MADRGSANLAVLEHTARAGRQEQSWPQRTARKSTPFMQDLTFEELCGLLRDEFGSAPVSSPDYPHVGDGNPVLGTLVLVSEGSAGFAVGAQESGQWVELARFDSEADACAFVLDAIQGSRRPGAPLEAAERAKSERINRDTDHALRRSLGLYVRASTQRKGGSTR